MLCSLLNDWNYFWNKYCNLPFLAICRSLLPLLIFLASSWYQKLGCEWACETKKKWLIIILKDFIKQPVIKQSQQTKCFFSVLIKAFANFEKLTRFCWQVFIIYKNGEILKMLIEIFFQKLIVSKVILPFLDHLKPKIFFVDIGATHRAPPHNLWIRHC